MNGVGFGFRAQQPVRFGTREIDRPGQPSHPEQRIERFLDTLEKAAEQGQLHQLGLSADGSEMTFSSNGENFQLSREKTFATMPERYTLKNLSTGESLHYVGAGCFGIPSVRIQGKEQGSPDPVYGTLAGRTRTLISQLFKLV